MIDRQEHKPKAEKAHGDTQAPKRAKTATHSAFQGFSATQRLLGEGDEPVSTASSSVDQAPGDIAPEKAQPWDDDE
eukprot:10596472-Lingulodinium_polyedra.AAC.1